MWAALVLFLAVNIVVASLLENQTFDEGMHLTAGYDYISRGDFRLNPEHPPWFKMLCALPLLALKPSFPSDAPTYAIDHIDQIDLAGRFLHFNRVPSETLLYWGRVSTIVQTLLFALLLAWWTRRKFGSTAALIALALFATDSNFIAHGHYITNDVPVAFTGFAAVVLWIEHLETRRKRWLVLAGVAMGLALTSKLSGVFVVPVFVALWMLRACRDTAWRAPWRVAASFAIVAVLAMATIGAVYGPETVRAFKSPETLEQVANPSTGLGRVLRWVGQDLPIPAHPYLRALNSLGRHAVGHPQYLLGELSMHGWWYSFPVTFAVKTPSGALILLLAAAALAWGVRRRLSFAWSAMALTAALYFAIAMAGPVNLGVRYLLPLYAPLYAAIAAVMALAPRTRVVAAVLALACLLQVVDFARIVPHHTAFINTLSGGPAAGPRYLADSNIDWGQDLKKLKHYLDRVGWTEPVCVDYFGTSTAFLCNLRTVTSVPLPYRSAGQLDCLAAISVTQLTGVYSQKPDYAWLRNIEPVARVGYSIYVYDLRKNKTPMDWRDRGRWF